MVLTGVDQIGRDACLGACRNGGYIIGQAVERASIGTFHREASDLVVSQCIGSAKDSARCSVVRGSDR